MTASLRPARTLPPHPVRVVAALALAQIPVLVGIGWIAVVFMDALLSPTGGATAPRVQTVVAVLALAGAPAIVSALGVWRGREHARTHLITVCRVRMRLSAVACLFIYVLGAPLVLVLLDAALRRALEDPGTVRWCAVSPAPGPGSPPR